MSPRIFLITSLLFLYACNSQTSNWVQRCEQGMQNQSAFMGSFMNADFMKDKKDNGMADTKAMFDKMNELCSLIGEKSGKKCEEEASHAATENAQVAMYDSCMQMAMAGVMMELIGKK